MLKQKKLIGLVACLLASLLFLLVSCKPRSSGLSFQLSSKSTSSLLPAAIKGRNLRICLKNEFKDRSDKEMIRLFQTGLQQWLAVLNLIDNANVQMGVNYTCDKFDAKIEFIPSLGRSFHNYYDLKKSSIRIYRGYGDGKPESWRDYITPTQETSYDDSRLLDVITHELGHGFGLDDLYLEEGYDQNGQPGGGIMASGISFPISLDDKLGLAASFGLNAGQRPSRHPSLQELSGDELLILFVSGLKHYGYERCSHFFVEQLRTLWTDLLREYGTEFLRDLVVRANYKSPEPLHYFTDAFRSDFGRYESEGEVDSLPRNYNAWSSLSDKMEYQVELTHVSTGSEEKHLFCRVPSSVDWVVDRLSELYSDAEQKAWLEALEAGKKIASNDDYWLREEVQNLYDSYDFLQSVFFIEGMNRSSYWRNPIYSPFDYFNEPFRRRSEYHAMFGKLPKIKKLTVDGVEYDSAVGGSLKRRAGVIEIDKFSCVMGYAWQGGVCKRNTGSWAGSIYSLSFPNSNIEEGFFSFTRAKQKSQNQVFECLSGIRYFGVLEPARYCRDPE